jgi:hypothetical protein
MMPAGYGIPESDEGMLDWSWAVERLETARNYWFGTTRPEGRPHVMPGWAVWLGGELYFEGSPLTRRARNLALNPAVVVHLESGDEVVILEGEAREVGKPDRALAERLAAGFTAKYAATTLRVSAVTRAVGPGRALGHATPRRLRLERVSEDGDPLALP